MNRRTLEQYFPALRKYASRLGNWRRSDMTGRSRYSRRHLEVRKCVVRAPIPEVAGIKILFVSDLHWFDSPENRQALEALEAAAAEIAPDYLALGGDITEDADHIRELPEVLTRLRRLAPTAVAVPGNWETGKRWLAADFWKKLYADSGIVWLENRAYQSGPVRFHGIADVSSGDCRLPERDDPGMRKPGSLAATEVLVAHSPDTIIALDEGMDLQSYDVALCGHNHGGQIRLPLLGALYCPSRYGRIFDRGVFRRRNSHLKMVVSTGMGQRSGSIRFNCPREVMLLIFRPAHHYRFRGAAV